MAKQSETPDKLPISELIQDMGFDRSAPGQSTASDTFIDKNGSIIPESSDKVIQGIEGEQFNIIELNPKLDQIRLVGQDGSDKPVLKSINNADDAKNTLNDKGNSGLSFNVNKHSSFFSNFISNFTKNFKAGQNSKFVILPIDKTANFLTNLFTHSKISLENRDKVKIEPTAKINSTMENPKKSTQRFTYEQVDWKGIEQTTGVTPETLKKTGDLERFLNGQKTSLLSHVSGELTSKSGITIKMHQPAKIRLVDDGKGKLSLVIHGVRPQADIRSEYLGYKLADVDKHNLKTVGEMGKVVELIDIQTKQPFPSLIGIDPDTKEMVSMRADRIAKMIPDTLKGVQLSDEQKKTLAEGKPTLIADMIDKKGEKFTSHVVISAGKQGLDFRFKNDVPVLSIPETAIRQEVKDPHKIQIAQNNEGNKTEGTKKQDEKTKVPSQKVESGKQIGKKEANEPAKKKGGPKL